MKTVVITGVTGTLGVALAQEYKNQGWKVVGVTRRGDWTHPAVDEVLALAQDGEADAKAMLACAPDVVLLNAGQIESEVGEMGEPLLEQVESMNRVNYSFPATVAMVASEMAWEKRVDIVAIGSIADGSPSAFGPAYHATKAAIHYFVTGVGPILNYASPNLRLRLYRPGVIYGPLSWSPILRLNERGYKVRAARCNKAPQPDVVAKRVVDWVAGDGWVGSDPEPLSFRFLKLLYGLFPNGFYKLQILGWKKASRYASQDPAPTKEG